MPNSKHSFGVAGEEQHVARVAVAQVIRAQDVALAGAGRQARARADALDVPDHRREPRQSRPARQTRPSGSGRDRLVLVMARAPAQPAPITMPSAASSSSAWMTAEGGLPVRVARGTCGQVFVQRLGQAGGGRDRVPGGKGDAAPDAPSAPAVLPSISSLPSLKPVIGSTRKGSVFVQVLLRPGVVPASPCPC